MCTVGGPVHYTLKKANLAARLFTNNYFFYRASAIVLNSSNEIGLGSTVTCVWA